MCRRKCGGAGGVCRCFEAHKTGRMQIAPDFFKRENKKKKEPMELARRGTRVWISDRRAGVRVETSETKVWMELNALRW